VKEKLEIREVCELSLENELLDDYVLKGQI
jgi:hypothetical protein